LSYSSFKLLNAGQILLNAEAKNVFQTFKRYFFVGTRAPLVDSVHDIASTCLWTGRTAMQSHRWIVEGHRKRIKRDPARPERCSPVAVELPQMTGTSRTVQIVTRSKTVPWFWASIAKRARHRVL